MGKERRRDEEELAELLRDAELLLSIAATAPLDDLSTMIVRLLAVDLEELQPTRRERVRQLVARLQAAKQSRDAAATQLEEDLEEPATRAELLLQEARQRLQEGRYGTTDARQLADEMDALAAANPDAERTDELRAMAVISVLLNFAVIFSVVDQQTPTTVPTDSPLLEVKGSDGAIVQVAQAEEAVPLAIAPLLDAPRHSAAASGLGGSAEDAEPAHTGGDTHVLGRRHRPGRQGHAHVQVRGELLPGRPGSSGRRRAHAAVLRQPRDVHRRRRL